MSNWIRIFGTNATTLRVSALVEQLDEAGVEVTWEVMGDDQEWEQVSLQTPAMQAPVMLERMALDDPEIHEEVAPLLDGLERLDDVYDVDEIEQVLGGTRQLYILGMPAGLQGDSDVEQLSLCVSQLIAKLTKGIYQVDQAGFYDADGQILLEER